MKNIYIFAPFFLVVFMFILASFLIIFYKVKTSKWPYLKNDSLLTEAEKKFYFILSEIIGNDYLIFSKVRMADLLHLPKMNNSQYYHYHNKIQSKHVDFLICDKENIKPLLVLELDDSSHLKIDRILRDTLVDKIFENAQVPILHVKNSATYDKASLLKQIKMTLI